MPAKMRLAAYPDLCRGCQACTLACSLWHEGVCGPSLARLWVSKDLAVYAFQVGICHHCDSPECVAACPVDAMSLDERGVVIIHEDACIRCGACAESCPYDAILYDETLDRYLKCDLCAGRESGPLCAELCPVGALTMVEADAIGAEVG